MILQNPKSQQKRFDFLCLNEGEIYFQSFQCSELKHFGLTVDGRIHFCSHTLIFVPEKTQYGIVKIPFNKLVKSNGIAKKRDREVEMRVEKYIELRKHNKNHPYIHHVKRSIFVFSLQHTPRDQFLEQIYPVIRIWNQYSNHIKITERLKQLYNEQKRSFQFDITYIDDFREKQLFEANVTRIKPLMEIPGKLVMTNEKIYYQPFHNIGGHPVRKIPLKSIVRVIMRRYLLRHTGVEIFLKEASLYFVFESKQIREKFKKHLFKLTKVNLSPFRHLKEMTRKWQFGETSNFDYLLFLNFLGDRSFNDLTQYPVFPWVIKDQSSSKLDFSNPKKTFRDLSKPIGALNPQRLKSLKDRYQEMPHPKFLYGTHYSTPYMVLYYLMRSAPEYMLRLQNGRFDNPDRLFYSFENTWISLMTSTGDVKELIPEFFHGTGSFLLNNDGLDLGTRVGGEKVHHILLPSWTNSTKEFIYLNRVALESDYVSQNIHNWIDLIFGYKQRGKESEDADNVFHWLTYEGNIKLDEIKDPVERRSKIDQIREFGQTPKQLFFQPHPKRAIFGDYKVKRRKVTSSDRITFENIFKPFGDSGEISNIPLEKISGSSTPSTLSSPNTPNTPTILSLGTVEEEIVAEEKKISVPSIDPNKLFLRKFEILSKLKIHRDAITSVKFTRKNPNIILTSSQDSTVLLFDIAGRRRVRKINRFGEMALSGCIPTDDDEKNLIISSWNNNLYFYSTSSGKLMNFVCGHEDAVSSIKLFKNTLSSSSWDGTVKCWNIEKQCLSDVPILEYDEHNSDEVQCCGFSDDGNLVFSGDKTGCVVVFDRRERKPIYNSRIHDGAVTCIEYRGDNKFICCSEDKTIRVHELQSGDICFSESEGKLTSMMKVDDVLLTGNSKGVVECWDINNLGKSIFSLNSGDKSAITSIDCNRYSLISSNEQGKVIIWKKK